MTEPPQKRIVTEEDSIEHRQVAQDPLEIGRTYISSIQPLGLIATMREVKGRPHRTG
jgi:hypothetical protein